MYAPIQTGIPREVSDLVDYQEFFPFDPFLNGVVYCFWSLRTQQLKTQSFDYLVLPDGCIDIVFDISKSPEYEGALIMTPSTVAETIQIRSNSKYVGIRLYPGAWRASPVKFVGAAHTYDTLVGYDFIQASVPLRIHHSVKDTIEALQYTTRGLIECGIVESSLLINLLLAKTFRSVEDMMQMSGYSRRQLQRILRERTGYTPHDFMKVVRFQRALGGDRASETLYSDQSHFIRECKRITGTTPACLRANYDLMSDLSKTTHSVPVKVAKEK